MTQTHHWINPSNPYPKFYNDSQHYRISIKPNNPINKYKYFIIMVILILIINLIYYLT